MQLHMNEFLEAEEELTALKQKYGIEEKDSFWKRWIDRYFERKEERIPVAVSKKTYCLTALFGGWLGIHQFMVGKKGSGMLYLFLSITGISFAMSVMDIWYAAFLETDEKKRILI